MGEPKPEAMKLANHIVEVIKEWLRANNADCKKCKFRNESANDYPCDRCISSSGVGFYFERELSK